MGMLPGGDSFRCTARKEYNRAVAYTVAAAALLTERRQAPTLSDGVRPKKAGLPSQRGAISRNLSPAGEKRASPARVKKKDGESERRLDPHPFLAHRGRNLADHFLTTSRRVYTR